MAKSDSTDNETNSQATGHDRDHIEQDLKIISIFDNYFAGIIDPKEEDKNILEFKLRETCRSEIIDFIKKKDLTQRKIAEMVGANRDFIRWFLSDGFFKKVSDNAINLIIKWYLRFLRNPKIYEQIFIEIKSETEKARSQIDKYFSSIIDPKKELKEIEDLKQVKGEEFFKNEICDFILKHRIKWIHITKMTGLSDDVIKRFLTEKNKATEHSKWIIYRWYHRYSKNPQIFQQAFSITNIKKNILEVQSIDNDDGSQSATGE